MTPEQLQQIAERAAGLQAGPERVLHLREEWPQLHFSHCLDDEVGAFPAAFSSEDFNLYLVSGKGGCGHLTSDLDSATGLVVADRDDD